VVESEVRLMCCPVRRLHARNPPDVAPAARVSQRKRQGTCTPGLLALRVVDRVLYPESSQNLLRTKERLSLDNAEMACKWNEDQEDRYTVKCKPSTNLKHHLLKSCAGLHLLKLCAGFYKSDHWTDPDVVRSLLELASKVLCLGSGSYFSRTCMMCGPDA
jgi:hypothetical protein